MRRRWRSVFRESAMHMFVYLALALIIYAVLADRTDGAIEREMTKRRPSDGRLGLVEDFDVRPDLGPRYGRLFRRHARQATPGAETLKSPLA